MTEPTSIHPERERAAIICESLAAENEDQLARQELGLAARLIRDVEHNGEDEADNQRLAAIWRAENHPLIAKLDAYKRLVTAWERHYTVQAPRSSNALMEAYQAAREVGIEVQSNA